MAMQAGSVSIDGAGQPAGSGLARELYDALESVFGVSAAQVPQNVPGAQEQLAKLANTFATVTLAHITTNAEVTVASGIAVQTTGNETAQAGTTTATGTGTIS